MSGDVVENVRLGEVIQASRLPDGNGGGELAIAQAIEKHEGRNISRNRSGAETGQGRKEAVDILQTRNTILGQTQGLDPRLKAFVRKLIPTRQEPLIEPPPSLVIPGRVLFVGLSDVQAARNLR